MKRSEVYREAAERVFSQTTGCRDADCGFICCALSVLAGKDGDYFALKNPLRDLFMDDAYWWNADPTPEFQELRALALLFMAAIAESEE
jgi:hypothetical protein